MAFNSDTLQLGRGYFNNEASKYVQGHHLYYSNDDLQTILAPTYFPPYLGADSDSVKIGDSLSINASRINFGLPYLNNITLFFTISSVNPLVIMKSPQIAYTVYGSVPYSGPSSGSIDLAFSRDANDNVYFYIMNVESFALNSIGSFTFDLDIPLIYQPDYDVIGSSVLMVPVLANVSNNNNVGFAVNFKINAGLQMRQMADKDFGLGATIIIQNSSFFYKGAPLT